MDISAEALYPSPFVGSPLLPLLLISLATQRHSPITRKQFQAEYDYIVVGAGSAGSVVASRLSEVPCINVLLLETGNTPTRLTEIPALGASFVTPDIDWQFKTVPQRHTGASLVNRQVHILQGKTLGGSSSVNGMIVSRGNRHNYDEWATLGAEGWSYADVLPYFLKLEDNNDADVLSNGYHNVGGPVSVSRPRYNSEVKNALTEAALSMGFEFVDSNGPTQFGFTEPQGILRGGQRCSTAKAYLVPSENRTNLDIVERATVTKVLIRNGRAEGVQFDFQGSRYEVKARREVIVSAGAFNTPKLLMLSGIGPKAELQKLAIPVVANLPVGDNLQDHFLAFVAFELFNPPTQQLLQKLTNETNILKYIYFRTGPLASLSNIHLLAYLSNNATKKAEDLIDYEMLFAEIPFISTLVHRGITQEVYDKVLRLHENKAILACVVNVVHPRSRGTIRLRTRNPYDPPDIDPNYMDDARDIIYTMEGMKTCGQIFSSPAMSRVGRIINVTLSECEQFSDDLVSVLRCTLANFVLSDSHPVGTAKMGNPNDPTTVVDPLLRVKGIQCLRVVDASVMPTVIWGHTNIPTIMIAEKASDIIKSSINCNCQQPSMELKT